jgi:ATP-binding cassette, subfamily B, bacterial MsbA
MKEYIRILKYADNLGRFLPFFILFSALAGIFGVLNLVMLKPLLDVLFGQVSDTAIQEMASKSYDNSNVLAVFEHYFANTILKNGKLAALQLVCVTIVFITLLSNVFRYLSMRKLEGFKSTMVANLRSSVFAHILGLDLAFFSNEKKGDLISRITTDVQEVENSIANSFSAAIKEFILLVAYLITLFSMSWQLTLFSLIVIPVTGGFLGIILKRMRQEAGETQHRLSQLLSIMDEAFGSMRVVKAFGGEGYITDKFNTENNGYRKAVFNYAAKRELANPFSEFIGITMVASLLYYGGSMILSGENMLSASTFIAYIAIFSQVVRPAKEISQAIGSAQRGLVSARRILEILDKEKSELPSGSTLPDFKNEIVFENVSFGYSSEKNVLENIQIRIPKGKTVALVGGSGGGKSTLSDLLMRFYDPQHGAIKIDNVALTQVDLAVFRSQIGIVPQEPTLYNDSIWNNIAFGRKTDESEIQNAAKTANAANFIEEMPDKYQSNIGDRGTKLSGGQRQRISIARAILKNPPLLILDEATSALDTESERLVQDALTNLMKNRTTLIIAHRLSTIQAADYIYVLQEGKIVEHGSHENLMQTTDGYYKKLIKMQEV